MHVPLAHSSQLSTQEMQVPLPERYEPSPQLRHTLGKFSAQVSQVDTQETQTLRLSWTKTVNPDWHCVQLYSFAQLRQFIVHPSWHFFSSKWNPGKQLVQTAGYESLLHVLQFLSQTMQVSLARKVFG